MTDEQNNTPGADETVEELKQKAEELSPMEVISNARREFAAEHYEEIGQIIQAFLIDHKDAGMIPVTEPAIWLQILAVNWLKSTIPVTHYEFAAQTLTDGIRAQLGLEMIHSKREEQN